MVWPGQTTFGSDSVHNTHSHHSFGSVGIHVVHLNAVSPMVTQPFVCEHVSGLVLLIGH
jgi:hypothetical protein